MGAPSPLRGTRGASCACSLHVLEMSQYASDKTKGWTASRPTKSQLTTIMIRGAGQDANSAKLAVNPEESTKQPEEVSNKIEIEKVNNKYNCAAGAGSDFFPMYRKHRNHELERLRQLDFDW